MTGKPKLPRLWDEKITTGKGRKVRRYGVHSRKGFFRLGTAYAGTAIFQRFTIWDKLKQRTLPVAPAFFRTRAAAENWLKKTTVRWYELAMLNKALDKCA
jgi:hypothetical protein